MKNEDVNHEIEYYLSHLSDDGFRMSIDEGVEGKNKVQYKHINHSIFSITMPHKVDDLVAKGLLKKTILIKIWKGTEQLSYRSSELFKFSDISDDIHRFISNIINDFDINYIYTMRRPKYWEDGYDDPVTLLREEYDVDYIIENDDLGDIKVFSICLASKSIKESLNIPKFKDFISKYRKSQYISSNSIRHMKDKIGIEYTDFKSINDSVNNVFKFFNKCDDDTFSDILQYVIDDIPTIGDITIRRNINVNSSNSIIMDPFDFVIDKSKSEVDVTDIIVCWVEQLRDKQIKTYNQRKEDDLAKRPGHIDYWTKYMLKRLKYINMFEELYINPGFLLKVNFREKVDWDSLTNVDYEYNSDFKKNRRKMRDEIIEHIKSDECVGRYLSAIGYSGVTYDVTTNPWVYGEMSDDVEIKVKINLEKK